MRASAGRSCQWASSVLCPASTGSVRNHPGERASELAGAVLRPVQLAGPRAARRQRVLNSGGELALTSSPVSKYMTICARPERGMVTTRVLTVGAPGSTRP